MIEAVPVTAQLRAWHRGAGLQATPELLVCGVLVTAICLSATVVPLQLSARRLEQMEW